MTGGANLTIEFGPGTVSKVQFEPGTVATPFEARPVGAELALCQRYFQSTYPPGYGPGATTTGTPFVIMIPAGAWTMGWWAFATQMRAAPTVTYYNGVTGVAGTWRDGGGVDAAVSAGWANNMGVSVYRNAGYSGWTSTSGHAVAEIEL